MFTKKHAWVSLLLFLDIRGIKVQCSQEKITDQVFLDISCDGAFWGTIKIGLFGEVAPKTVGFFKQLIGRGYYEQANFEGIVERLLVLIGPESNHSTGLVSSNFDIVCEQLANDKPYIKHNGPGYVSTATDCKFLITTMMAPGLNNIHTVFGKVLKGQDIVHRIEHIGTNKDFHPIKNITVARSGLVLNTYSFYESTEPYELTLWGWIKAGWFPLSFSFLILSFFQWTMMHL